MWGVCSQGKAWKPALGMGLRKVKAEYQIVSTRGQHCPAVRSIAATSEHRIYHRRQLWASVWQGLGYGVVVVMVMGVGVGVVQCLFSPPQAPEALSSHSSHLSHAFLAMAGTHTEAAT